VHQLQRSAARDRDSVRAARVTGLPARIYSPGDIAPRKLKKIVLERYATSVQPVLCLAFFSENAPAVADCANRARQLGIPVRPFT
jgi:hypothetical protein